MDILLQFLIPPLFSFETQFFNKEAVEMAGTTEYVVKGGTNLYPLCGEVFKSNGIKVNKFLYSILMFHEFETS